MIKLGTSGFSYDDWVGPVYPPDLPKRDWLAHYAARFDTVELNVTYYRLPDHRTVQGWAGRTPPGFIFAVKAFQGLTHDRSAPDFPAFTAAIAPLTESGKLACVLAQFPHAFHPDPENRAYLERLRQGLGDLPAVVEFRDSAWLAEATFDQLRSLNLGFCCVDEPRLRGLLPPVARATGSLAYVRFHGRNAANLGTLRLLVFRRRVARMAAEAAPTGRGSPAHAGVCQQPLPRPERADGGTVGEVAAGRVTQSGRQGP
ncbi:MAG: DUF72 domain-containing protein [Chloroflexi bacterium]|nr:DUF72 domain-containing protein [Chloroflexota bacterium]